MTPQDDEFYIGYEPVLPRGIRTRLRAAGAVVAAALLGAALVVLLGHPRLGPSRFDFGHPARVTGVLVRDPYPSLALHGRRTWLVGQGKRGAEAVLARLPDGPIQLDGTAIERGPHTMLEVVAGTATVAGVMPGAGAAAAGASAGPEGGGLDAASTGDWRDARLRGEIVDSKCFLGVMNPGESPVHRDCASLCLKGGIPPMLLIRDASGAETLVLLVGPTGGAVSQSLAGLAGVPVEVRGRLTRDQRGLVLAADASDYRRLTR